MALTDLISYQELDQLTNLYSDQEISVMFGWYRNKTTKIRRKYGIQSFKEKTGLCKRDGQAISPADYAKSNQKRCTEAALKVTTGASRPNCRKYTFDEDFFEVIDTEAKAYFLGLIIADGNIEDHRTVSISLKGSDVQILNDFKQHLNHTGWVRDQPRGQDESYPNAEDRKRFRMHSVKMVNDLGKLGLRPNKSVDMVYPTIDPIFDKHCIRGMTDGDGCIMLNGEWAINICTPMVPSFTAILDYHCFPFRNYKTKSVHSFSIRSSKVNGILPWLYQDSSVYLQRKYDRACQWFGYRALVGSS